MTNTLKDKIAELGWPNRIQSNNDIIKMAVSNYKNASTVSTCTNSSAIQPMTKEGLEKAFNQLQIISQKRDNLEKELQRQSFEVIPLSVVFPKYQNLGYIITGDA